MNAFQVIQYLLVNGGQFFIQTDSPIPFAFFALCCIRTAGTILALVDFFLPSIFVSLYRLSVGELELFPVRADQVSFLIRLKIYGAERVQRRGRNARKIIQWMFFSEGRAAAPERPEGPGQQRMVSPSCIMKK